ncbi:type II toxin-antitoxin system RelE/ParE family toxin [Nitrospira sp. BLG_1]|uniref:type II toxin-antitoxin system RelE/ParE family toxin n=1 Tax=Nitrospira sp. BLG_1 TaxID=3395883 RepID=UPI0039BD1523
MIKSFRDANAERIFKREFVKGLPREIQRWAFMKLNAIDAAVRLEDLRLPASNRLEALKGDRKVEHSIRINDQWRICFLWRDGHAERVQVVDYH